MGSPLGGRVRCVEVVAERWSCTNHSTRPAHVSGGSAPLVCLRYERSQRPSVCACYKVVGSAGIEPASTVLQTAALPAELTSRESGRPRQNRTDSLGVWSACRYHTCGT